MTERQFQVRSIGTQDITLHAVVDEATALILVRNSQAIFRLCGLEASKRDDGTFDVCIKLTPDNGMVTVTSHSHQII
jgi:hypothetical protein